jgi:hypothetical protein
MFKRVKNFKDNLASVATNSPAPSDFELSSIESRAAARAMLERRRPGGPEGPKRIRLICPMPRPQWVTRPYDQNAAISVRFTDDPEDPE